MLGAQENNAFVYCVFEYEQIYDISVLFISSGIWPFQLILEVDLYTKLQILRLSITQISMTMLWLKNAFRATGPLQGIHRWPVAPLQKGK